MHFELIAYLILFYTVLAIILCVYFFLVFMDWFKRGKLVFSFKKNSEQGVNKVLNMGLDMNEKDMFGQTPLMGVVKYAKSAQMLHKVLEQCDVNLPDEHGVTPLMLAAEYNTNAEIISELIYAGANVNAVNKVFYRNALMIAAAKNTNPDVIRILLASGVDVNAIDYKGKTALMRAAQHNPNPAVVTTLLNGGADKQRVSNSGKTAQEYALENPEIYKTQAYYDLGV